MSAPRRLASKLLRAAHWLSSPDSREWANAMLRELDFIEGDWAALFWAIGSLTAIFRRSGRGWIAWLINRSESGEERTMKDVGKNALGVLSGIAVAALLAIIVAGLHMLAVSRFPSLIAGGVPWKTWILVIGVPEAILIVSTVKLWRRKKPMAVGILLSALLLATHFVMHVASHWKG